MQSPAHRDLLPDVLTVGAHYPLVLAGDVAVRAHGLTSEAVREASAERSAEGPTEWPPEGPLEVATESPEPMNQIAATVGSALTERGWQVRPLETDPLSARLLVTDPGTGEERTVDLVKETFWRPPVTTGLGPTLALDDLIGTKVRAFTGRGTARDLTDLQSRLEATELLDDRDFTTRGLPEESVPALRRWVRAWADDIAERLLEEEALGPPAQEP